MMVAPVDHRDVYIGILQRLRGVDPAKTTPDDHDLWPPWCSGHHFASFVHGFWLLAADCWLLLIGNDLRRHLSQHAHLDIALDEPDHLGQHLLGVSGAIADTDDRQGSHA